MSRYLPDPSVPVSPLGEAVHAALQAAAGAPLLALAYPPHPGGRGGPGWHITLVETATTDVREGFPAPGADWQPALVEREFTRRGYVSRAHLVRREWDTLADGGRCTPLYRDNPSGEGEY